VSPLIFCTCLFDTVPLSPQFSHDMTLLTIVRSSCGLHGFSTLLVPPRHKQDSLECCHGSSRKAWYWHTAASLGFCLRNPFIWQTAKQTISWLTLSLLNEHVRWGLLYVFVLTCLQDTSAPTPASVHLAPRDVPTPGT
jgi:hypothetical protein